jgi:hypothetical protein
MNFHKERQTARQFKSVASPFVGAPPEDQFRPAPERMMPVPRLRPHNSAGLPPLHNRKAEHYFMFFPSLYRREWNRACPAPRPELEEPPFETVIINNPRKLEIAQKLSDWTLRQMKEAKADIAVIARGGSHISKTQDRTWMEHSGILIYNRKRGEWEIYNLLNDFCDQAPRCDIWRNKPLNFFYTQPNHDENAMLLIPDKALRKKLRRGIESGAYKKLQFTKDYNVITRFDGDKSLNCNKWVLMNLVAAQSDDYEPQTVLAEIGKTFKPGRVLVCPIIRPLAKQHPTVLQSEAPLTGPLNTVTAESLYRSDFFEKKLFYDESTASRLGLLDKITETVFQSRD